MLSPVYRSQLLVFLVQVHVLDLLCTNIFYLWTSLTYGVTLSFGNLRRCFWQFKPNGESTWTRLVGWDNINKERIGMSPLKQDISFLASKPCTGGIMIHSVTNQYEGVYQFSIIENLEDKQHITIQGIGVKLIKGRSDFYWTTTNIYCIIGGNENEGEMINLCTLSVN